MNPKHLNLYIVDDDEAVRRSLASLLRARLCDCAIQAYDSGESFLQAAQLDASGVLVLDLRMQGISGLDVFQQLQERGSPLVVVFLSGHGDIPVAVRYFPEASSISFRRSLVYGLSTLLLLAQFVLHRLGLVRLARLDPKTR